MIAAYEVRLAHITILKDEGGDWTALYVNGRKIEESHSISLERGLRALGIPYKDWEVPEGEDAYPETLSEAYKGAR